MEPYLHKVQYYETDKMGIAHHSNYIRWMEEARVDFLEKIGWGFDRLEAEEFDILQIIAASRNIFVVADDDQSIYGFRGASPSCVSSFYRNQNDCKLYHLSKNYRSVQNIVRTSEQFISKNTDRFDKNLYSEKECGRMPQIKECRNSILQAEFVVKELRKLQRRNPYLETGILYRNNISYPWPPRR